MRQELRLDLFGDFHLVSCAALLQLTLLYRTAFGVQHIDKPGGLKQIELVAVDIIKSGVNTPRNNCGSLPKLHTTGRPFLELLRDVIGHQCESSLTSEPTAILKILGRINQDEDSGMVRRADCKTAILTANLRIHQNPEAQLFDIEFEALILIANKYFGAVYAKVRSRPGLVAVGTMRNSPMREAC